MTKFRQKRAIIFIICIIPLLLLSSCRRDSDVLVHMKSMDITRGEFYSWIKGKGLPFDDALKSIDVQKRYLKNLAVELLTSESARREGFESSEYYVKLRKLVYRNLLASHFSGVFRESVSFNEKCADISIIRININAPRKSRGPVPEEMFRERERYLANTVLPLLKKGEKFEAVARKFSGDPSAKKGGHVGFITGSMMGGEVSDAVKNLTAGEYTTVPLRLRNALYIIKVNRWVQIDNGNFDSIVTDSKNAKSLKRYITGQKLRALEKQLREDKGVVSMIGKVSFSKPDTLLFSIKDSEFRVRDLDDILNLFYELKFGSKPLKPLPEMKKRRTTEKILSERLFALEAETRGIDNTAGFKEKWKYVERAALSGTYKFRTISLKIKIPKKDVDSSYRAALKRRAKAESGKRPRKIAKSDIERSLFVKKLSALRKKRDRELLAAEGYQIKEDELAGK